MNILIIILSVAAGIVVLLLIIALFTKRKYSTFREIVINAPLKITFNYLKQIRNQDNFNKWMMVDPNMEKTFKGTDGTVGFIYRWSGNKEGGEGEQEIKAITEGKNIEMEIRFIRPFAGIAHASMTTEAISYNQTKVSWTTASEMKYPFNIMLPFIVKILEKDMGISLAALRYILEKEL